MSCPEEIPPRIPPAWLLRKPSRLSSSPCWEPRICMQSKPDPMHTPLTAFKHIIPYEMSASRRFYPGSAQPDSKPWGATSRDGAYQYLSSTERKGHIEEKKWDCQGS